MSQHIHPQIKSEISATIFFFLSSVQQPLTQTEIGKIAQEYFKVNGIKHPF